MYILGQNKIESTYGNVLSLKRFDSQKSSSDCHSQDTRQTPLLPFPKCYSVDSEKQEIT